MEELLLVEVFVEVHEGVAVVEVLRSLDKTEPWIDKVRQGLSEELRLGDMVRIKHCQQISLDVAKGKIQVARLRVLVIRPSDVASSELMCQLRDVWPCPIIDDPRLMRRLERQRRSNCREQDIDPLVIGRNHHCDGEVRKGGVDRKSLLLSAPELEHRQREPQTRVDFQKQERNSNPPSSPMDGEQQPPSQIRQ